MPASRFVDELNAQIGHEFAAHQQYIACAIYYDGLTVPRMASFFFRQALEERDHAMMMVRYLLDSGARAEIPGVEAPRSRFVDIIDPIRLALEQEKRVTDQINNLTAIARAEHDFASDQFIQWFIKEQVEEVATMTDLLTVVTRAKHDIEAIEDYVDREHGTPEDDPSAPPAAGA